jgi:AraC family transcriptional regulator of adaptative response/methylated-DNA-[protein]-cysteine methyltransferase
MHVVRFVVTPYSLGSMLVAASDAGICAITFGDDAQELLEHLQKKFPTSELIDGGKALEKLAKNVLAFVEEPTREFSVPLDLRGTAFQQSVWKALKKIPVGTTATYADIARTIGHPKAVRAVAQACGANPVAVAIPCHRVVRSDGSLSGYRWGVERKAELLRREQIRI